jgi:hypothetical protein
VGLLPWPCEPLFEESVSGTSRDIDAHPFAASDQHEVDEYVSSLGLEVFAVDLTGFAEAIDVRLERLEELRDVGMEVEKQLLEVIATVGQSLTISSDAAVEIDPMNLVDVRFPLFGARHEFMARAFLEVRSVRVWVCEAVVLLEGIAHAVHHLFTPNLRM